MPGSMIGFIAGLLVGSMFGVFTIALMKVAGDADDRMHDFSEKKDKGSGDETNDQSPTE